MERLENYLDYWHRHRPGRHGLLPWVHVDEGFADNGLQNWAWEQCAVEAVDLNSQLVREPWAFAQVLEMKGRRAALIPWSPSGFTATPTSGRCGSGLRRRSVRNG